MIQFVFIDKNLKNFSILKVFQNQLFLKQIAKISKNFKTIKQDKFVLGIFFNKRAYMNYEEIVNKQILKNSWTLKLQPPKLD